jgi:hypothetical protein
MKVFLFVSPKSLVKVRDGQETTSPQIHHTTEDIWLEMHITSSGGVSLGDAVDTVARPFRYYLAYVQGVGCLFNRSSMVCYQSHVIVPSNSTLGGISYCSDLPKSASFSCWALMNASLNWLASDIYVSLLCSSGCRWNRRLTLAVGEADSQRLSLWLALADIGGGVPDPAAVAADVGRQLHVRDNCAHVSLRSCIHVSSIVP